MSTKTDPHDGVKTTRTTFEIIKALRTRGSATLPELEEDVGVAKSTIHRHLQTLVHLEYALEEDDQYRLSMRFLHIGEQIRARNEAYVTIKPKVREIAQETDERAQFNIEEHGKIVYVFKEKGKHAIEIDPLRGSRFPIHTTAAGKAILAHLPEDRRAEILDERALTAQTDHSITDHDELLAELETVLEEGYALNDQENIEGLRAVGVPVFRPDGGVLGAFSVSGPTQRLKGERWTREIPDYMRGIANEIQLNLAYSRSTYA